MIGTTLGKTTGSEDFFKDNLMESRPMSLYYMWETDFHCDALHKATD